MSTVELRLLNVGIGWLQDLGRPGLAHLGIAENGAADRWSAEVANTLVGNSPTSPLIEITGSELTLAADADLLLAATGAAPHVLVGGIAQPTWETLVIPSGQSVTVPGPARGLRSYLAVHGQLAGTPILGSIAPDRSLGTGHTLRTGAALTLQTSFAGLRHPHLEIPVFRMGVTPPIRPQPLIVTATVGPDLHEFSELGEHGIDAAYAVSPDSDAVGLRLLGPSPRRSTTREILSRGVPVGAVEVPPSGGLLLLLRGRLVTAGYPVIAVATLDSIDRLGQARPGDELRFTWVDAQTARERYRQQRRELDALTTRVRTALTAVGLGSALPPRRSHGESG